MFEFLHIDQSQKAMFVGYFLQFLALQYIMIKLTKQNSNFSEYKNVSTYTIQSKINPLNQCFVFNQAD